jgi:putative peptidoglycan lipid II flippase
MSTRLARSAGLIGAATMTSRVLGVARETVLAALFGAGNDMDAFNVAFRIPNLLRDLFAEGAMSAAFIATFTRHLAIRGRDAAWRLGNLVTNALFVMTAASVIGAWFLAPAMVRAIAPEYAAVPGKLDLTIVLTRIMLPFIPMVALSVAMMGMLNSVRRFFVPALSPATFNVATIAAAFTLVPLMPRLGWPRIAGIAIGTLVGGLGQILLQWPVLKREGWRYAPVLDMQDAGLREVLLLMAPGTLGLAAVQMNVFVNTVIATSEGTGAVSWLNYAFRIMYLPIGLFGASIGTAVLPEIARHAAMQDIDGMRRTVSGALRLMLMLNIPATVGLVLLARPIVSMLLERGQFGPADTSATAAALMCYAPGLIGYSVIKIASPSFYSLRDSRTPVIASAIAVATNLVLNLTLVRILGFRGLALGTAISAMLNAAILLAWLRRRLGGLDIRRNARALAAIVVASIIMGIAVGFTQQALERVVAGRGTVVRTFRVFTSIAAGLIVLTVAARLLRIEEFNEALGRMAARLTSGPASD